MTIDNVERHKAETIRAAIPLKLLDVTKASLIAVSIAASAFLLWQIRDALLLVFAAIMAAILLHALAACISRWTAAPRMCALPVAILVVAAVVLVTCWLFGTHVAGEFTNVSKRVEEAWSGLGQRLQGTQFAGLGQKIEQGSTPMIGRSVREGFMGLGGALSAIVLLVVSSIYLAAEPRLYRVGLIKLFKPELQEWAGDSLDTLGQTMKLWLYGQLLTMLIVGLLSFFATWSIGVPGPIALALIAALTEAVPYIGPFLGGIPAVLVASTKGLDASLLTAGAYLCIHLIEGYLCGPLIQRYFVSIPPALMLLGIAAAELIFGTPGIIVAAPLTVAIFLVVKLFYVRDTLHVRTDIAEAEGFGRKEGSMIAAENRA